MIRSRKVAVVDFRLSLGWVVSFAVLLVVFFWPTFLWMAERFDASDSFYSHGWLVPAASGWLIWQRRKPLAQIPWAPTFQGLWLFVPSLLMAGVSTWLQIGFVSGFAMLGTIAGLIWTSGGAALLKALRFPLFFLVFMVPLPGIFLIHVSFQMKLMAAQMATLLVNGIGIPATQAGSSISIQGTQIMVDDTCSGLRSLISLLALATFWTALMPATARAVQRAVIVAASVPIALLGNMARIFFLILLSTIYGHKAAEGFLHYGSGFVVFGVAVLALTAITRVVQRW